MTFQKMIPATPIEEAPYSHGAKKAAVLRYIEHNPHAGNAEIARALKIRAGYVGVIRQRAAVTSKRGPRIVMDFRNRNDLHSWLLETKPDGLSVGEHAMSMLNDIMMDEIEAETGEAS